MLNCHYLRYNERLIFYRIIEEKKNRDKTILQGIVNNVNVCYERYLKDFPVLQNQANSEFTDAEQRRALNACYTSQTRTFKYIVEKIYTSQPDILKRYCPYCMLGSPDTIDHYVGKTEFPEYSVFIKNMVPCCFDCNNIKLDNWRNNEGRNFIHYYNDLFLQQRFLYATLNYQQGAIVPAIQFYLQKPVLMNDDEFAIVQRHFQTLDLLTKYSGRSNTLFSTLSGNIQIAIQSGLNNPVGYLNGVAQNFRQNFGVNYWEAALSEAMALSRNFIANL